MGESDDFFLDFIIAVLYLRRLFLFQIMGTIITYLVVLMQFPTQAISKRIKLNDTINGNNT